MIWDKYPNFSEKEFKCSHTGRCAMNPEFMEVLQRIRIAYGKPMIITSGFRDKTHPIEAEKTMVGTHALGLAADIAVRGEDALELIRIALAHGIKRIGVNQKGEGRFIHVDLGHKFGFTPSIWSY